MPRQPHPLTGHPVEIRRLECALSETAQISITEVISKNKHNVRRPISSGSVKNNGRQNDQDSEK
jgi:hypothetical protein